MVAILNYVIIPFEGNINPGDPEGLKLYLQATKDIENESDKWDISVSNAKDVVEHLLSLAKKYVCGPLMFMLQTSAGDTIYFLQVDQIQIEDTQVQAFKYFGPRGIVNLNAYLPSPVLVSAVKNLAKTQQEIKKFHDKFWSYMISRLIGG